jgi:osmotically-inducible protein OsmY
MGTQTSPSPERDNSKVNKRDDAANNPTADQQNNENQDVETTRKIRSALTDNDALSTYAHNVKIITQKGQVVLRGPVRSADEKRAVEAAAAQIAGEGRVKSEIEVSPE